MQSSGLARSVWLLLQKEKEKNERDIAQVKETQSMWQAAPCWQILCGMYCFPNFFTSPQRFILWITYEIFFFWLSTLGTFFGTSFTQPELLMIWALLIYTYQWLKIPVYNPYCTLFQLHWGQTIPLSPICFKQQTQNRWLNSINKQGFPSNKSTPLHVWYLWNLISHPLCSLPILVMSVFSLLHLLSPPCFTQSPKEGIHC